MNPLATLTSLDAPALARRRFALAVVDEATQAVEPAAYLALLRAERVVLAGDHLQLPPTVLSAAAQAGGLGVSLFERLLALHGDAMKVTLAEQHRMHEAIMRFPSDALYGGLLRAHPDVAGRALDGAPLARVVDERTELGWIWLWAIVGGVCGFFARSAPRLAAGLVGCNVATLVVLL